AVHDFLIKEVGRGVPYGVYDLAANAGWVRVGIDHDTAAFAVQTIRTWWHEVGKTRYPGARRLERTPVEVGVAGLARRTRDRDQRPPFPARHLEVEQDRAPPVLVHQHELAS